MSLTEPRTVENLIRYLLCASVTRYMGVGTGVHMEKAWIALAVGGARPAATPGMRRTSGVVNA